MPLPPAPSELGAKLATTRTKASAREDAPRSETLEELRERIRARNPRPVEPAAAAPAEKATAPAPTKESQPAKPAEKSAKKKQKKAPVAAAKKETQRKETPKTAAPVAKSEKTAPADVSARAAAPSDEKPVPTVPAESVYVPPPAEKKPSEAFPAADRLFAAATQGKTVVKPASHRRGRAVVREDRKKLFVLDTNVPVSYTHLTLPTKLVV